MKTVNLYTFVILGVITIVAICLQLLGIIK